MDAGTKLDGALFVLTVGALYLRPEGKREYWLCRVCVMSRVICVDFCLVLLLYILMRDSCCCPIILLVSLMILFSGFLLMLDSAPNQEVMLKVIMDSMKHL